MLKLPANQSKFIAFFNPERLIIVAGITLFSICLPSFAQLPPTNMGKFVHQPGDNQYSYQTQVERHPVAAPAYSAPAGPTAAAAASGGYKLTPAEPKPDISLLPVLADEPIKPAGFPPLPDRLDLPSSSGTGSWAAGMAQSSSAATLGRDISSSPTGVHEHYVHYNPGAFIPKDQLQQPIYGNSNTGSSNYKPVAGDYYNVNPGAHPVRNPVATITSAVSETPSTQVLHRMGPEPQLAADTVSKPEVPNAVTVNQSVSQDLSLPEDDFNKHYPTNIGNSANSRTGNGLGRTLMYPLRSLYYTGYGMGIGMAAGAGATALHR